MSSDSCRLGRVVAWRRAPSHLGEQVRSVLLRPWRGRLPSIWLALAPSAWRLVAPPATFAATLQIPRPS